MTSTDVIHGFWVPDLFGQIDANPGRMNHITYTANREGEFRGVCAMLCGAGHSGMLFRVTTQSAGRVPQLDCPAAGAPAQAHQRQGRSPRGRAAIQPAGAMLIQQKGCGACHTIPGVPGANGTVGPNLAGVAVAHQDRRWRSG